MGKVYYAHQSVDLNIWFPYLEMAKNQHQMIWNTICGVHIQMIEVNLKKARIKKGANSPNKNWNEARYVLQQGGISSSTHANGHALLQEACILYLLLQFTQVFLWPCQYFNKISIWEQFYGNESQLCYQKKMATLTAWFISSQTEEISFFAIIFPKRPRMGVTGESIPCFLTGILRISAICMHTPCCKVRDNFHFQTRKTLFTVLCGTCNSQFKINAEKQTKRQIIKQNWDGLHLIT